MGKDLPKEVVVKVLQNPVWSMLYDQETKKLILDCRNEESNYVEISKLDLQSLELTELNLRMSWREKLISASNDMLYSVKYEDQNDPTRIVISQFDVRSGKTSQMEAAPDLPSNIIEPSFFDSGSDFHRLVMEFLAIDLALPCEYLEYENFIIISYYLRSEKGFDRFLLLLKEGEKVWKLRQDHLMKGFAPGAFFVAENMLVFVRDRNEVCISIL